MGNAKLITDQSIFRVLTIFEKCLKKYRPLFYSQDYDIKYVVKGCLSSGEFQIQLFFTPYGNSIRCKIHKDQIDLISIIQDIAAYFSINEVHLVHPKKEYKRLKRANPFQSTTSIQERVGFL